MRYGVLGMLCVAALIAYVQRSAISVPAKIIQQELGMDAASMGLVMAVWYWGYALFQIPSGWLADYLGSRKALVFYAITWSVFTAIAGLATSYEQLLVFWCLMGIAQAGIFPASAKAIGAWFS
ncbi:MAG: MFS transporter, partial [Planctomycetota bacterium]